METARLENPLARGVLNATEQVPTEFAVGPKVQVTQKHEASTILENR